MMPAFPRSCATVPTPIIIEPPPPERPARWWFVHVSIVTAFVLFFLFVAVLYFYWIRTPEPTSVIHIPGGNDSLAGTIVQVEGYALRQPLRVELNAENNYGTRIYLVPGSYRLQVVREGGDTLFAREFSIEPYHEWTLNLDSSPRPAKTP
jgi:hypothetical protein